MLFVMEVTLGDGVDCQDPVLFFPPTLAYDSLCFFCAVFDEQKVAIPNL